MTGNEVIIIKSFFTLVKNDYLNFIAPLFLKKIFPFTFAGAIFPELGCCNDFFSSTQILY